MKKFLPFLILLTAVFYQNTFAQSISNEGTDFWAVFPTHDQSGANYASMNINVTSKNTSEVVVSCGSWSSPRTTIPANSVVNFVIPRSDSYIEANESNQPLINRAIHIAVTPGKPKVVAYGHVYEQNRSAATLILPFEALGQRYFSMNYTQDIGDGTSKNFLTLVAVENNTKLILHKLDGSVLPIELKNKGDVYQYLPDNREDLTGTFVEVDPASPCQRFAAFSGSSSVSIGCTTGRDPLLQQLYSVNSWGKTYGIIPFINRRYIVRILAQYDNTSVSIDGAPLTVLMKGRYFDQILNNAAIVSADKPVSVAEYSFSTNCSSVSAGPMQYGDPEMVLLNPVEFNIKNITLFSSGQRRIFENYINVFIKTSKTSTFKLNGLSPGVSWTQIPADPSYSYSQIKVNEGSLTLTADDGFNAIAYGFGQTESYAYSAGTNLYSTSTLSLLNLGSQLESKSAACLGQPTVLKLSLPYKLTKITWKSSDGTVLFPNLPLSPPIESVDNLGAKVFTYSSPSSVSFSDLGTKNITAIAVLSVVDAPPCFDGADIEFNFEIDVVPLGKANFDIPEICAGSPAQFFDKSNITGSTIAEWKWEFDGQIKTEQNPIHTFASKGNHTVKLSVANASGCWSDVFTRTIQVVKDFPQLEFLNLKPVCITDNPSQLNVNEKLRLAFTKKEFTGKGISLTGMFDPKAAGVGIHQITYTFTSKDGCTDSITQNIEVYAATIIDVDPIIYILAGGERTIPASIISPNPNYNYKYNWTAGAAPATGLSNNNVLNPIAFPEKDTKYTLTVSIDGLCSVTKEVLVRVLRELDPPTAFSPNNDQINDVWNIKSLDSYPKAEISIFNRNGQKVFSSIGYTKPFDGNFRGTPLPVGVYYYVIDPKNGRQKITGPVTIIR